MNIDVVMPVINYDLALELLDQIDKNTKSPRDVHIMDNTNLTHFWMIPETFNLHFYHSTTGMVNESWEILRSELHPDCDYVSFLNDDLIIGDWFFKRVIDTFEANKDCGIVCPNTVDDPSKVIEGDVEYVLGADHKLEGWAFTIKKDILDQVPPIPWKRVTTFYGDNWIWDHVKRMGYTWKKDLGNTIYHYVGQSILKFGYRSLKKPEYNEYNKIKEELWD